MPAPFFKDIDRTATSLLADDFKFFKHLKVKGVSDNGVEFTTEAVMTGAGSDKKVSAKLGSSFEAFGAKVKKLDINTQGRVVSEAVLPNVGTKGLAITWKGECGQKSEKAKDAAKLGFQFQNDDMSAIGEVDVLGGKATSQLLYRKDNVQVGGDLGFSMEKGEVTDYNPGVAYRMGDSIFSVRTRAALNIVNLSVAHKLQSSPIEVATFVSHNRSDATQTFTVGCKYTPDKDTQLKAKVDTDGILSLAAIQKVSASMKLFAAAEIDSKNLEGDKHKFGLGIALS